MSLAAGALAWNLALAASDPVALAPDHPTTYTVVPGDTLWDISGRFLRDPWRWPDVWRANPQIRNPHLIYPGDQVTLSYSGGKPVLRVRRGRGGTVKLSPSVRYSPVDAAIPTIPIDAIAPFLNHPQVLSEAALERLPHVLSTGRESLVGVPNALIYARGVDPGTETYTVLRKGRPYEVMLADGKRRVAGIEAQEIAVAKVERHGDPATLLVTRGQKEILVGDALMPLGEELMPSRFSPAPPEFDVEGRIIDVVDGVTQIGQYMMVVLDVGAVHGLEQGHVLEVLQAGEVVEDPRAVRPAILAREGPVRSLTTTVADIMDALLPQPRPWKQVKLPEERAGFVMVVTAYDEISYALVMDATRAMHKFDHVRTP